MAARKTSVSRSRGGVTIQLSLVGLAVLCVALVAAVGLLTYGLITVRSGNTHRRPDARVVSADASPVADVPPAEVPPWGELLFHEIELEQPEEYIAFELDTNRVPAWTFAGMSPEQVRALMSSCGMAPGQVEHALSPALLSVTGSNTVIRPDDELILGLAPPARSKLYGQLAHAPVNHYMRYPFCYPGQTVETLFSSGKIDPALAATVRTLLYPRGEAQCLSDYEWLLRRVPAEADRLNLVKTLSRQSALLARIRIRPDTDVEKILGYWSRGIQVKVVRPLLESLTQLPDGGSISILYVLPPFARQRLYTFPQPSKPGDPAMDCHWSTMNFFNETPEDRFADPNYTAAYLSTNYYQVAKPTLYGDLIFLLDDEGNAVHSAVHVADDIVFTKNGNNFAQPWMVTRLKDLLARYTSDGPPRLVVYRNKNW